MNCPPKVKVGYKDIAIELVRSDFSKQTDCYGEYQHRANKIEIQKDLTPTDLFKIASIHTPTDFTTLELVYDSDKMPLILSSNLVFAAPSPITLNCKSFLFKASSGNTKSNT